MYGIVTFDFYCEVEHYGEWMLCSRRGEMLQVFSLVFNLASEGVRGSSAGWQHAGEK